MGGHLVPLTRYPATGPVRALLLGDKINRKRPAGLGRADGASHREDFERPREIKDFDIVEDQDADIARNHGRLLTGSCPGARPSTPVAPQWSIPPQNASRDRADFTSGIRRASLVRAI